MSEENSQSAIPGPQFQEALTFDDAKNLPQAGRVVGLKVKGQQLPFGGSWRYDKDADELTLTQPPTVTK